LRGSSNSVEVTKMLHPARRISKQEKASGKEVVSSKRKKQK